MYKEDIITQLLNDDLSDAERTKLIEDFYTVNLNLVKLIAKEQCLSGEDYYDCLQLGFFAICDALKVYKPNSKYSFLSYFRRAFKHQIFLYNLEFRYPVRIKSPNARKTFDKTFVSYGVSPTTIKCTTSLSEYSDTCYRVEQKVLHKSILFIIDQELTHIQKYIIIEYFWEQKTKSEISRQCALPYDNVRYQYLCAMKKLKKNKDIQRIAKDMYGIKV